MVFRKEIRFLGIDDLRKRGYDMLKKKEENLLAKRLVDFCRKAFSKERAFLLEYL